MIQSYLKNNQISAKSRGICEVKKKASGDHVNSNNLGILKKENK